MVYKEFTQQQKIRHLVNVLPKSTRKEAHRYNTTMAKRESQESAQVCCLSACSSLPEALYGSGEFKLISSNFNANTWSPGKCLDLHSWANKGQLLTIWPFWDVMPKAVAAARQLLNGLCFFFFFLQQTMLGYGLGLCNCFSENAMHLQMMQIAWSQI